MKRFIDATSLKREVKDTDEFDGIGFKYYIDRQPTIEVQEVVRCKNCKSFKAGKDDSCVNICRAHNCIVGKNAYCNLGEKKAGCE